MRKEDIKAGAWIIWPDDSFPHPRRIIKQVGKRWQVNIKRGKESRRYI